MNKSTGWKIVNSLWIVLAFMWLINWTAFLFIGIRAKNKRWLLSSVFYLVTGLVAVVFAANVLKQGVLFNILMCTFFISWLLGIVHAFIIRGRYLEIVGGSMQQNGTNADNLNMQARSYSNEAGQPMSQVNNPLSEEERKRLQNFYSLICQIKDKYRLLKVKGESDSKFRIIEKFLSQYNDEVMQLDRLHKKYCNALKISDEYSDIEDEIKELEKKTANSSGESKEFLVKTLNEKRGALQEFEKIKSNMETSESKLYYILSVLEKIDLIIESADFSEELNEQNANDLNSRLSVFSDNLKTALNSMRL